MRRTILAVTLSLALVASMATALHLTLTARGSPGDSQIGRFVSYDELQEFVEANTRHKGSWTPSVVLRLASGWGLERMAVPEAVQLLSDAASAHDYSSTNIQVAGVDEADIVKTDGSYIYLVSANRVIIMKAYPPEEAGVLSEIEFEGTPVGIFIDGDRLVILGTEMPDYELTVAGGRRISYMVPYSLFRTFIRVYDVSDRDNPSLQREFSVEGHYTSSRMIGDYVYVVVNSPVSYTEGEVRLPVVRFGDEEQEIAAEDIYYCDVYDHYYSFTTIIAINTQDDDEEPTVETILLGASSNLYVSPQNIYLTVPVWDREMWQSEKTAVHRIEIDGARIDYVASGEVPGRVLNQFSMDEYDGYFRIATTTGQQTMFGWRALVSEISAAVSRTEPATTQPSLNHVYVLDVENLEIVGSLEDLAPTERIFSARFMGERAYLVTFEVIDPLFVIDLKDPRNPELLGELKITGYSDYLHPYDENHLIGIGKETVEAEDGRFSWMQGVKITLFDVTDVNHPRTIEELEIGDRGSDTPVSWDHKAFLFDRSRNLMVLPISVAEIDEAAFPRGVPDWAWGRTVWQGAYVFHVAPETGFTLRGGITHIDESAEPENNYYSWWPYSITRSLYIGDVLYTISEAKVMMNSLEDLTYINEVELPYSTWSPGGFVPEEPPRDELPVVEDPDDLDLPVRSPDR